jgi:hypothetical protein
MTSEIPYICVDSLLIKLNLSNIAFRRVVSAQPNLCNGYG